MGYGNVFRVNRKDYIMKKWMIPVVGSLALASAVQASEHAYLYKDARIMAMGGANVASGGYSASMFSNPAGIANLPNDHGLVVELLGFNATASKNTKNVTDDLMDAIDNDSSNEILDVFTKYSGTRVHVDVTNYSSVSMNHGDIAWSVGLLASTDVNLTPHGSSYGLLEVQGRAFGGLTSAYSHTLRNIGNGDLKLGVGAKFIYQKSYEGTLTPDDLLDFDNTEEKLRDKFEKDGNSFALDLGAIYEFYTETPLKPSVGLSILNIGELDFDNSYGSQPTTVNIGAAIEPTIPYILKTRVALDYMDLFNANKTRMYNLDTPEDDISFSEFDDSDFVKRLRLGISALVYENTWSSLELATGLYQGQPTAGFDLVAAAIRFGFSTYAEQLGPAYNDKTDRRYTATLGIVW